MKTLTKIKLINWHGFYDEILDVKGAVLFTGDNGCGKSTIIDALCFLLTGGEESKFNTAANFSAEVKTKAKRTLETYMRGRVGEEGKEFLRDEANLISHIALEFYDTSTNKYFVLGVVMEIQEARQKIGKTFYHIPNRRLDDTLFCEEKDGVKNYINYRRMEKKLGRDVIIALDTAGDSRVSIRRAIYSILQLTDKYYELLMKAVAFRPITDISDFVFKFLLPEKSVDIENIRENIRTYNEIQDKILKDKEKKIDLEKITSLGDEYRKYISECELSKANALIRDLDEAERDYNRKIEQRERAQEQLTLEQNNLNQYEKMLENIKETIYSLTHNESYLALQRIQSELQYAGDRQRQIKASVDEFDSVIAAEAGIAKTAAIDTDFHRLAKMRDYVAFKKSFGKYAERFHNEQNLKMSEKIKLEQNSESAKQDKKKSEEERSRLSRGLSSYKDEVQKLINLIEGNISDNQGKPIKVTPLCELVEMKEGEEEWRNAVEGYLNTRRFDLFVADRYYDQALRIYESNKKQYKIHGVGLVNCAKIGEHNTERNSLASKVVAENNDAQKYIAYLMGNVICVDCEDELKRYERAITRTVMVYQNKAARQTKYEVYATPYIGRKSNVLRLEQLKKHIEELTALLNDNACNLKEVEAVISKMQESKISYINSVENIWEQYEKTSTEIKRLKSMLLEAKQNNDLVPKIERHKQHLEEVEERKKESAKKIEDLQYDIRSSKDKEEDIQKRIEQLKPFIEQFKADEDKWEEIEEYHAKNRLSAQAYRSRVDEMSKRGNRAEMQLNSAMSAYITKYGFDATAQTDSLDIFYREYNEVILRDLAQFEDKLAITKSQASKAFQESYISEIRRHIEDERKNIGKLNHILAQRPFGPDGEVYQIQISRSAEKEFGEFYDIFIGKEDFDYKDLFTEQLSEKHAALMQELFEKLTLTTQSEQQDKIVKDYTDYRKFMSYDIVITNKRGAKFYFSKLNGGKSGGENQTPFYVIIAASFDQIIHSGYGQKSPGCLVMLDEAFNNMDGERIRSTLEYYAELEIQPLFAVPKERGKLIIPYAPTVVALVKNNNRIVPRVHIKV